MLAKLKTWSSIVQERVVGSGMRMALEKSQSETILCIYFEYLTPFHSPDILKIKFRFNHLFKITKQNYRGPCVLIWLDMKTWVKLITVASSLCLKSLCIYFLCSPKLFFERLTETLLCFDKIYFSAFNSSSSTFILLNRVLLMLIVAYRSRS